MGLFLFKYKNRRYPKATGPLSQVFSHSLSLPHTPLITTNPFYLWSRKAPFYCGFWPCFSTSPIIAGCFPGRSHL
jgi:hypothetical protein